MITINDADVVWIAQALNCTLDAPHVLFLKATTRCDLHACPGSGKTTLLIAKLALLARKWPWRDRGVLVLSHTNVARREVEQRLAKEPAAARLLGYPHFIGTIQGFVDRFLALPYLRDVGHAGIPVEEPRVDDDAFADRAARLFFGGAGWTAYPQARAWLKKKHDGVDVVSTLFYQGADLGLRATAHTPIPKANSPTAIQLRALKDRIAAEGLFRYADMFGFAAASVKTRPFLRDALRRRFPWVFVDEMQDTSKEQEFLLDDLFGVPSVVFTKIGDTNQAIFTEAAHDNEQTELKWVQGIDLPRSQRLAPKLAALVSPWAVVHPITLDGNPKRMDKAHTIFLFTRDSISGVLPAFGDLILKEWKSSLPAGFVAKAIGFRRRPRPEKDSVPESLVDYWPDFDDRLIDPAPLATLLSAVRHARHMVEVEGEFFAGYRVVYGALARLAEIQEGSRVTLRLLAERCTQGRVDGSCLKRGIAALLQGDSTSDANVWTKTVDLLRDQLIPGNPSAGAQRYLAWSEPSLVRHTTTRNNVFVHRSDAGTVPIEVATIHAVKGETHDATLLLETYWYGHDVESAIPVLAGQGTVKTTGRLAERLKRLFVGATRPKELLCIALREDHIRAEQRAALASAGWTIQRVG